MKIPSLLLFCSVVFLSYTQTSNATATNTTVVTNSTNQTGSITEIPAWLQGSQTELQTFMSDKYNYFVTPQGNKVWVCTMSMAWNQMKRQILNNQIPVFQNSTAIQDKIVQNFNAQLFTKDQLSSGCYYVSAGFGEKAMERINTEVRQKYPDQPFQPLEYKLKQQDFISYAYLEKQLRFKTPFSQETGFKFKNVSVEAFSAKNSKQKKQIYYKYYNNTDEFLMGIETTNPVDEVLFLKTNRTEIKNFRMEKVLQIVSLYDKLPNTRIKKTDTFKMPLLSFEYTRKYSEMVSLKFANAGFQQYRVSQMYEKLLFSLNKSGIKAISEAVIIASRSSFPMNIKQFLFNKDFWIILKQKGKKPYLVISAASLDQTCIL